MALGEHPARPRLCQSAPGGVRRRPADYFIVSPPPPPSEPPPREIRPRGGSVSISLRRVISFADSCHLLCSHVGSFDESHGFIFHPSVEGSGQARLEEPLDGERGDRFSSFHRRKDFCCPRTTKVSPHLVIRPLFFGLGVRPPGRFIRPATGGLGVSRPLVRQPPARMGLCFNASGPSTDSQPGPRSTPIL